jgi:hypothetical protein
MGQWGRRSPLRPTRWCQQWGSGGGCHFSGLQDDDGSGRGGGSAQATRKAWFSSTRTMRVVGGGPTLRHGIGMATQVGEGAA